MKVFAPSLSNLRKLNRKISLHPSLIWTLQVISNTLTLQRKTRDMAFFWYYTYTHLNKKLQVVLKVYVNWFNSCSNKTTVMGERSRPMESVRKRREMIWPPTPHQDCILPSYQSVQSLSRVQLFATPCLLSQWCHPTISSSVIPFSSCPQSSPASGSF